MYIGLKSHRFYTFQRATAGIEELPARCEKGVFVMSRENDVVIVSAARPAIGKFGGALKDVRAHRMAAHVMKEVLRRANNLDPHLLDDIIAGDCVQCFDEANTARTAQLAAGIPFEVPAFTVQRQCSSSMQALNSGVQRDIDVGLATLCVGGGMGMTTILARD